MILSAERNVALGRKGKRVDIPMWEGPLQERKEEGAT